MTCHPRTPQHFCNYSESAHWRLSIASTVTLSDIVRIMFYVTPNCDCASQARYCGHWLWLCGSLRWLFFVLFRLHRIYRMYSSMYCVIYLKLNMHFYIYSLSILYAEFLLLLTPNGHYQFPFLWVIFIIIVSYFGNFLFFFLLFFYKKFITYTKMK